MIYINRLLLKKVLIGTVSQGEQLGHFIPTILDISGVIGTIL